MPFDRKKYSREYFQNYTKKGKTVKGGKLKYGFRRVDNPKAYDRLDMADRMKRNPLNRIFSTSRYRAKTEGYKFTVTPKDVYVPKRCPILGIKLQYNPGKRQNSTYSLDRIDNSKGYIKGNVAIISWKANRLKNNLTPKQVEKLYQYMKDNGKIK